MTDRGTGLVKCEKHSSRPYLASIIFPPAERPSAVRR